MSHKTKCDTQSIRTPCCHHEVCWDEYFKKNIGKTMAARMVYLKVGANPFKLLNGAKYTKHFVRFVQKLEKKKYGIISSTDSLKSE